MTDKFGCPRCRFAASGCSRCRKASYKARQCKESCDENFLINTRISLGNKHITAASTNNAAQGQRFVLHESALFEKESKPHSLFEKESKPNSKNYKKDLSRKERTVSTEEIVLKDVPCLESGESVGLQISDFTLETLNAYNNQKTEVSDGGKSAKSIHELQAYALRNNKQENIINTFRIGSGSRSNILGTKSGSPRVSGNIVGKHDSLQLACNASAYDTSPDAHPDLERNHSDPRPTHNQQADEQLCATPKSSFRANLSTKSLKRKLKEGNIMQKKVSEGATQSNSRKHVSNRKIGKTKDNSAISASTPSAPCTITSTPNRCSRLHSPSAPVIVTSDTANALSILQDSKSICITAVEASGHEASPSPCNVSQQSLVDPRVSLWTPPASPFCLLEEMLYEDPWALLLACILLNRTTAKQARPILWRLLVRYPHAADLAAANPAELEELLHPLGLFRKRALSIVRFSQEYLTKDWRSPMELHAVGQYGADAYAIFCRGDWESVQPADKDLSAYVKWLRATGGVGQGLARETMEEHLRVAREVEEKTGKAAASLAVYLCKDGSTSSVTSQVNECSVGTDVG